MRGPKGHPSSGDSCWDSDFFIRESTSTAVEHEDQVSRRVHARARSRSRSRSSLTFCVQLGQRPSHQALLLVVSSSSFPLLLQQIFLSPPLGVVFPQSRDLQVTRVSTMRTLRSGLTSSMTTQHAFYVVL